MSEQKFTDLFEVSSLGKTERQFVVELKRLLDDYRGCIGAPITDDPKELCFFEAVRGLRTDTIFNTYKLANNINLQEDTSA